MTEKNNSDVRVHPTFKGWPLHDFKEFQKLSIEETGEPGIYWLTVKILRERAKRLEELNRSLQDQIVLYETMLYQEGDEPSSVEEQGSGEAVTLGGHAEEKNE